MGLGKVLTGSSRLLPNKRRCIDAKEVYTKIRVEQNIFYHRLKHFWIAEIQIPLVVVEYGHHPTLHFFIPSKVARGTFWKYLRHRLLKLVGNPAVFVGIKVILVFLIPSFGLHCPFMLVRGMVEHNVQHQVHPLLVHGFAQSK